MTIATPMTTDAASRRTATWLGISAVAMWSTLGVLTDATRPTPPFLLVALTFGLSGIAGVVWLAARGRLGELRQPWTVWLHGVAGLFGYHALYFSALRLAPPVEASLVCYLWPLLIVVLAGFLPGERLAPRQLLGAMLGFAGGATVILGRAAEGAAFAIDAVPGYAAAFLAAIVWAVYSVSSRVLRDVPPATVAGFCLATAILAVPCHLAFEDTIWPASTGGWAAVAALGALPVGLAFLVWDIGMKRGAIQLIAVASYATPIVSTLLLVAFGAGHLTWSVVAGAVLVSLGALLAARGKSG